MSTVHKADHLDVSVADTAAGIASLAKGDVVDLTIPYRGTPPSETALVGPYFQSLKIELMNRHES